jgi:hypothetical protein
LLYNAGAMARIAESQPMGFLDLWYPSVVGVVAGGGDFEVKVAGVCDRTTSEMRGCLPRSYQRILDEVRMHKHTHISIQYHIRNSN